MTAPGPHRVAVGVRDDLAATTSVVTFDLDAGNAPAAPEVPAAVTEAPSTAGHRRTAGSPRRLRTINGRNSKQMANAARRALELTNRASGASSGNDIRLRTRAYNALGVALFDKPDRTEQDVVEAEDAFRRVIAVMDDEASAAPRYSLARLLVDSGRVR